MKIRVVVAGKDTNQLLRDFFGLPDLGAHEYWEETYELEKIIGTVDLDKLYSLAFRYDADISIYYQRCDDCSMQAGPNCLQPLKCPECSTDMEVARCYVPPEETATIYQKAFPLSMWRCTREGCWGRVDYDLTHKRLIPYRTIIVNREN